MSLSPSPDALAATGLPDSDIAAIQQVLASHPEVEQAILYGSCAPCSAPASTPPAWPGSMSTSTTCCSLG